MLYLFVRANLHSEVGWATRKSCGRRVISKIWNDWNETQTNPESLKLQTNAKTFSQSGYCLRFILVTSNHMFHFIESRKKTRYIILVHISLNMTYFSNWWW